MAIPGKPFWTGCAALAAGLVTAGTSGADGRPGAIRQGLEAPVAVAARHPRAILSALRPDYSEFIRAMRPLEDAACAAGARRFYMALVKPGALDPANPQNAPYAGPGARNDVLYDRCTLAGGRSAGWSMLLLDHEYFHARHLAGATSLPVPRALPDEAALHFFEAAAWGFNVAEARAGRYPGLREDEFREALDRHGEHYRGLRRIARGIDAGAWRPLRDILGLPVALLTRGDRGPSAAPARPADPGRSAKTP